MKKHLMLSFCAFAALAFASCTKDADLTGAQTPVEGEGEGFGYLALSLNTDMVSRAEGDVVIGDDTFNPGSENEYKLSGTLNTHIAIFFDESGNYFGNSYLSARGNAEKDDHTDGAGHVGDPDGKYSTTEKLYTYITKDPRINKDGVNPTSAVVLLNVAPYRVESILESLNAGSTLNDLQHLIVEKVRDEKSYGSQAFYIDPAGEEFFTMTNSVYTDDNEQLQVATKIEGRVYESMEQALQHPVTIFVERVVAKHSLVFYPNYTSDASRGDAVTIDPDTELVFEPYVSEENAGIGKTVSYVAAYAGENEIAYQTINWQAKILGWDANALEENTFLYKNLTTPNAYTAAGIPFMSTDWWKAYGFHRSYWAIDPHYNDGYFAPTHNYPTQYRPSYDRMVNGYNDDPIYDYEDAFTEIESGNRDRSPKTDWALIYRPYTEIAARRNAHIYTLENTFAYTDGLKGYAPLRYGTHIIVAAELVFPELDTNGVGTKVNAEGYFWSVDAYINYAFKNVCDYLANGVGHTFKNVFSPEKETFNVNPVVNDNDYLYKLFAKVGNEYKKIVYKDAGAGEILATEVFRLDEAYLENGDGKRALKENFPIAVYAYTEYVDATGEKKPDANFKDYNSTPGYIVLTEEQFVSVVNTLLPLGAKYYNEGRMYYAIPVHHIENGANDSSNLVKYVQADDETQTAEKGVYDEGDFGVVRNHWYRLNVLTISKPGTPVEDPFDPIIPNDPEENDYMGVEIVILPWHVIEQDVYL